MKEGTRGLVALAAGLAGGIAISLSHSERLLAVADLVAPVGTLWVNAIRMTVIPLVVSLLITGVASASDISTIGRIGGRTLAVFLAMLTGATALAIPLAVVVFSWLSRLI
ncbi:MAG TPA: cation:dicarboxylase symporter family transporter, partial [Vicinamibacterales bacterium]|nr:cation:dicarboxylase symporter family transporter [Vicinamibacterales bacterium]